MTYRGSASAIRNFWTEKENCKKRLARFVRASRQLVEKVSQSFAAAAAKKSEIVFSGGVYVGENSSQPANVRIVRLQRTKSALQQAASSSKKWLCHFFDSLRLARFVRASRFLGNVD